MSQGNQRARTIAEIVAGIGVMLSLLLVALQIGQNTASVRAQTRQQLSDASSQFLVALATTDLGDMWGRYARGEELTDPEMDRMGPALVAGVRGVENVYLQYQEGVIDESALSSYGWSGSMMYGSEAFAAWWRTNRGRFNPEFVQAFSSEYGLVP